jgi:hypothetical protein
MNPLEFYMRAMSPFNQPYFAMLDAYAGFLKQAGAGQPQLIKPEPAAAAPPSARGVLTRRAMATAAARDATKKELAPTIQPASPERSGKTAAAVERAKRAWATRRANAAAEEKAARKAGRAKARARK